MQCPSITRALLVRIVFTLHALTCIILVQNFSGNSLIWLLTITLSGLFMETLVIIIRRRGQEWMWFSPSIFFYLVSVVPAIWFMELLLINDVSEHCRLKTKLNKTINDSNYLCPDKPIIYRIPVKYGSGKYIELESTAQVLEQFLLLLLIMGRWFMPKGKMSRAQLSQILLIYIGVAADIVELFEAFKEEAVRHSKLLTILVLTVWTISLLQFCFILVSKNDKNSNHKQIKQIKLSKDFTSKSDINTPYLSSVSLKHYQKCCQKCTSMHSIFSPDVLSILMPLFVQDTPFLILRLYFIIEHKIISYTNTFFTAKNSLVILLLVYRLIVIQMESLKQSKESSKASSIINLHDTLEHDRWNSLLSTPKTPRFRKKDENNLNKSKNNEMFSNKYNTLQPSTINISRSLGSSQISSSWQKTTYQKQNSEIMEPSKIATDLSSESSKFPNEKCNSPRKSVQSNKAIDFDSSVKILEEMIENLS